jgi:hypothetical protein
MFQDNPTPPPNFSIHDWVRTISTVLTFIISLINLLYAVRFFYHKDKKEDDVKEKDLRINWFKSLVLDYNLEHFHNFFTEIEQELQKLKPKKLTDKQKEKIIEAIKDKQRFLRKNFVDMLLAVDKELYDKTLESLDLLVDHITEVTFNSGINLSHLPKFDEEISAKIGETKTNILKLFFSYKG